VELNNAEALAENPSLGVIMTYVGEVVPVVGTVASWPERGLEALDARAPLRGPEAEPGIDGSSSPPGRPPESMLEAKSGVGSRSDYRGSTTLTVLLWFEMTYAMA
jgi:hypothetical protein